jgi:hypothetical protein
MMYPTKLTHILVNLTLALPLAAQAAIATLDRNSLLGIDNAINRTHFSHNIQSLERQLIGSQAANKTRIQRAFNQASASDNDTVTPITGYASAHTRAEQLGFNWTDTASWRVDQQASTWVTYTPEKHQGVQAALLTPLSQLDFQTLPADIPIVAQPTGWKICRVPVPQGTYLYGYYDGHQPHCIVGDPHTMRWDDTSQQWQHPVTIGTQTHHLPRQQTRFEVLPVADVNTLTERQLLPALVQVNQQAHGFAIDHAADRTDTLWPADTMGYQLGRLVNTTGIIDIQLQAATELTIYPPEHCNIRVQIPQADTLEPLTLRYQTPAKQRAHNHYRCQIDTKDLQHWLDTQQTNHPGIAAATPGDLAFLSVSLPYTYHITPTIPNIRSEHRQQLQDILADIPQMQQRSQRIYQRYQDSTTTLITPRLPHLQRLAVEDLGAHTLADLTNLVQQAYPGEFYQLREMSHTWRKLQTLTDALSRQDASLPDWSLAELAQQPSFLQQVLALLQYNQHHQYQQRLVQLHTQLTDLLATYGNQSHRSFLQQERYREARGKRQHNLHLNLLDLDKSHLLHDCDTTDPEQLRQHPQPICQKLANTIQRLEQNIAAIIQKGLPYTRYLQALHTQHRTADATQSLRDVPFATLETWVQLSHYASIRHQPTWKHDSAALRHVFQQLRQMQRQQILTITSSDTLANLVDQLADQHKIVSAQPVPAHNNQPISSARTPYRALRNPTITTKENHYPITIEQANHWPGRLKSYAQDNLAAGAGIVRWGLQTLNDEGTTTGAPQIADDSNHPHFTIQPGQRYRLYQAEDSAEAWAESTLYLAEGQLHLKADPQADDQYELTFSPQTGPVVLRYQSQTDGGRVYNIALQFAPETLTEPHQTEELPKPTLLTTHHSLQAPQTNLTIANHIPADDNTALTLELTVTNQTDQGQAGITTRLSNCLERFDQGDNGCQHDTTFSEPQPPQHHSARQLQAAYGVAPQPEQLLRVIPVPVEQQDQPQQLTIRTPLKDQHGKIQGYRQHWHTLYNPAEQYRYHYEQQLTQGTDPLVIRPFLWQRLEAAGLTTTLKTHLTLIDHPEGTNPLQNAIARYNAQESDIQTLYGITHEDTGLDNPAMQLINPIDLPHTPAPLHTGEKLRSFIQSTQNLLPGTYTFEMAQTIQIPGTQHCETDAEGRVHCLTRPLAHPGWQKLGRNLIHTVKTLIDLYIQYAHRGPFLEFLIAAETHTQNPIQFGQGIKVGITTAPDQATTQALPYDFQVRYTDGQHGTDQTDFPANPPFSQAEQQTLADALEDMGYRPVTHQPLLCPGDTTDNADCTQLPLNDQDRLWGHLSQYDSLQLALTGIALITLEKSAAKYIGAALALTNAAYHTVGRFIRNTADDTQEQVTIRPGQTINQPTIYVRLETEPTLIYPHSPETWLSIPEQASVWQHNHLYLDYASNQTNATTPFCVTLQTEAAGIDQVHGLHLSLPDQPTRQLTWSAAHNAYCLDTAATQQLHQQQQAGTIAHLILNTTTQAGETTSTTFALHSLNYTLDQLIATNQPAADNIRIIPEHHTPEETHRRIQTELTLPGQLAAAIRDTLNISEEDVTLEINRATFRHNNPDEEQTTSPREVDFSVHQQIASLEIEEHGTDADATLSLQGILLQGSTWEGELHLEMTLNLSGHNITLRSQENVWLSPYLEPTIQLSWEDYHSQRPIEENSLSILVRPNLGQPLEPDWVDAHLLPTLNEHYNPTLEQLYTNRQVAQQVRELVDDTLPTAPAGYIWVRASHYRQLRIQLSSTDWEQAMHQPQTLHPDQLHWSWVNIEKETTTEAQHTVALATEPDLFIGLDATDLHALRAPYAEGGTYAPESPAILWRANDFTIQLATLENHEYGAFVPQAAWDFFEDDVNIDWQSEKGRTQHGGGKHEGQDDSSNHHTLTRKRSYDKSFNMRGDGGDGGDGGDEQQGNNNSDTPSEAFTFGKNSNKENTSKLRFTGTFELDSSELTKKFQEAYQLYFTDSERKDMKLNLENRSTLPLAISMVQVKNCNGEHKEVLRSTADSYEVAIDDNTHEFDIKRKYARHHCEVGFAFTVPDKFRANDKNHYIHYINIYLRFNAKSDTHININLKESEKHLEVYINGKRQQGKYELTELVYETHNDKKKIPALALTENHKLNENIYETKILRNIAIFQHIWRELALFKKALPEQALPKRALFFNPKIWHDGKVSINILHDQGDRSPTVLYHDKLITHSTQISSDILYSIGHSKLKSLSSRYILKWKNSMKDPGPTDYFYDTDNEKFTIIYILKLLYLIESYVNDYTERTAQNFSIEMSYNPKRYIKFTLNDFLAKKKYNGTPHESWKTIKSKAQEIIDLFSSSQINNTYTHDKDNENPHYYPYDSMRFHFYFTGQDKQNISFDSWCEELILCFELKNPKTVDTTTQENAINTIKSNLESTFTVNSIFNYDLGRNDKHRPKGESSQYAYVMGQEFALINIGFPNIGLSGYPIKFEQGNIIWPSVAPIYIKKKTLNGHKYIFSGKLYCETALIRDIIICPATLGTK